MWLLDRLGVTITNTVYWNKLIDEEKTSEISFKLERKDFSGSDFQVILSFNKVLDDYLLLSGGSFVKIVICLRSYKK